MTKTRWLAILIASTGCAALTGASTKNTDSISGRWSGEIEHDGWSRRVWFDLDSEGGGWRGRWQSFPGVASLPFREVAVQGDEVRLETERLRFVGRVMGDTLSGTVADLQGAPAGDFSVTREDTRHLGDQ
jgi:hypothetical protein